MAADLNDLGHGFISRRRVLDPAAAAEGQLIALPARIPHLDLCRRHVCEIELIDLGRFASKYVPNHLTLADVALVILRACLSGSGG